MDRRTKKTRTAILEAFTTLLNQKRYHQITIQNIIDEANIGRSTFYDHFTTKDALLQALLKEIFDHVFTHDIAEETHDYTSVAYTPETMITHILQHFSEEKKAIRGLLSSESGDIFSMYLRNYITEHFEKDLLEEMIRIYPDIPRDFLLHHLCGSFFETVKWWFSTDMSIPPKQLSAYFIKLTLNSAVL